MRLIDADKLLTEIDMAIESNRSCIKERYSKGEDYESEFVSQCRGKIDALIGIEAFVENEIETTLKARENNADK